MCILVAIRLPIVVIYVLNSDTGILSPPSNTLQVNL